MGTVHAKTVDNGDTDMTDTEAGVKSLNLMTPAVVEHVHVEGLQRTKTDFIVPEIKRILEATTFGEVVAFTYEARENLQNLNIFKNIDMFIDTSSGPNADPNGMDVTLLVKEKRVVTSKIGTQVGSNEGMMVFGVKFNNLFGRAESVKGDLGFGTKTKSSYQLGFTKPFSMDPIRSFYVGANKSTTEFPSSSYKEASQGLNLNFTFPSRLGQHSIGWEGTWREVIGLSRKTSFSVREQAGHSLKSSLMHALVSDSRDSIAFSKEGSLLKLTQELAGLGGDVQFIKHNFEIQESLEVLQDVVLSWSMQAGILNTMPNDSSRINDRFFIGGPLSVRGFQMNGIGPRSEGDSLGGDAYWTAALHLYTPLPFRPGEGSFGDHIKTHIFLNAGNLSTLSFSSPWKQMLDPLRRDIRWSYGIGLVFILGIARVELNYCLPRGTQPSDGVNHGLQVGVGMNFV